MDVKHKDKKSYIPYLTGVDKEIFERLPLSDKRPYISIGNVSLLTALIFSAFLIFFLGSYSNNVVLKFMIGLIAFPVLLILNRQVIGKLINHFDSFNSLLFALYGILICAGFFLSYVFGIARPPSYSYYDSDNFSISSSDSSSVRPYDSMTNSSYDTTIISYPSDTSSTLDSSIR